MSATRDVSGAWSLNYKTCTTGTASPTCSPYSVAAPTNVVGSCTLTPSADPVQEFTDGNLLGWGVVAAMVAAWGITVLRRGIS